MPEMVASYPSQRFSALLDFQRNVDLVCPSHIGKKSPAFEAAGLLMPNNNNPKPNHHRGRHGDTSWQESWSESLTALLSSSFQRPSLSASAVASPPRSCAVESRSSSSFAVTRSQGQFSPQKFIRNALKRAFGRDDEQTSVNMKRARFEDFGSTAEAMVCG